MGAEVQRNIENRLTEFLAVSFWDKIKTKNYEL
jgi:hypothetical protein